MNCPCCGQNVEIIERPILDRRSGTLMFRGKTVKLPRGIQLTVLAELLDAFPNGVDLDRLTWRVYSNGNEPECAYDCIRWAVCRVRKFIAPLGLKIPKGRGRVKTLYYIQP